MSKTGALLGLVVAGTLGWAACTENQDTVTDDTTTATATIDMTLSPDPATAVPSVDEDYQWQGTFDVEFAESGGVGVTVSGVTVSVQESSGGIPLNTGEEAETKLTMDAPSNRIEGNSSLTIGFTVAYTLPNGGREALVTVTASLVDDNSHTGTFSDTVTIQ